MLQGAGYRVTAFPDGARALRAALVAPPDLALVDIMMPKMSGFELCQEFKAHAALRRVPVIFVSALNDTASKLRAFAEAGVDYVSKPFHAEEVLARVRTHLRLASLQRQLEDRGEHLEQLVAERTRDLTLAHERLVTLDRVKDDFLRMISHEVRTPANGVLGMGNLILDLTPETAESREYRDLFRQSGQRLCNLIDDATLIANLSAWTTRDAAPLAAARMLKDLRDDRPDIEVALEPPLDPETVLIQADPTLLRKAIGTALALGVCFSSGARPLCMQAQADTDRCTLRIPLDQLDLTPEQAESFFALESPSRSLSRAESLGLAPVVAHRIVTAFGGELRLTGGADHARHLELTLVRHSDQEGAPLASSSSSLP
jgi:CheY-like chemotaxis protein